MTQSIFNLDERTRMMGRIHIAVNIHARHDPHPITSSASIWALRDRITEAVEGSGASITWWGPRTASVARPEYYENDIFVELSEYGLPEVDVQ